MKQVIAVRTDLKMGKGKIAAQVGHSCVMAVEMARNYNNQWYSEWLDTQKKIVVRVPGGAELESIRRAAAEMRLPHAMVTDAGHTQLEPGTATCVCVGPAPSHMIDRITGDLPLL